MYLIFNTEETMEDGRPLFWSNVDGWVSIRLFADEYTETERDTLNLPMGGEWVTAQLVDSGTT